jgi:anti-sigma factor RsiW
MNAAFDDERLSAYLDGELSPDERQALDARLSEDGELRQALEELRALGVAMQALPRHRLDEHFSSEVMRRAEIEMLTGNSPQAPASVPPPTAIPQTAIPPMAATPARLPESSRPFGWRALLWTAASLGVAALIWNQFDARRERQVARDESTGETSAEKTPPKDTPLATDRTGAGLGGAPTTFSAVPSAAETAPKRPDAVARETDGVLRRSPAALGDAKSDIEQAASPSQAESRKAPDATNVPEATRVPAATRALESLDDSLAGAHPSEGKAGEERALAELAKGEQAQATVEQLAVTLTASDAVVVCEITPQAANDGLVYQLLAEQAIDPADKRDGMFGGDQQGRSGRAGSQREGSQREAGRALTEQDTAPAGPANDLDKAPKKPKSDDHGGTDLLEIEATPEQIAGLLTAMRRRTGAVTAVHELQRANVALEGDMLNKQDRRGSVAQAAQDAAPADAKARIAEKKREVELKSRNGVDASREPAATAAVPAAPSETARSETAPSATAPSATDQFPAHRAKRSSPAPSAKSLPAEEAPRAGDAPAQSPSRSFEAPDRRAKSATPKADHARNDPRSAQVRARSRSEGPNEGPSASRPEPAAVPKEKSESAEKRSADKQTPDKQAAGRGVYRKFSIPPAPAEQRGGSGRGQDGNEAARGGESRRSRFFKEKSAEVAAPEGLARRKVVLLIQVRPPLAAGLDDVEPVPAAAPPAEPARK